MSKQLTIQPSGQQITLESGETLLDAALRSGFAMPYGCKNGACGACKGKILRGSVTHTGHSESALSSFEAEHGWALFCCATAQTDVEIECKEVAAAHDIQVKTLPCRVQQLDKIGRDVAIVHLKLPVTERFNYLAGQYIDLHTRDGRKRSYSIANAPALGQDYLELHVRHVPGGYFSSVVWNEMEVRDIYRFTGPLGTFFLREDSDKPILLLATGTGFAPIKGMLEQAFADGLQREIVLYWGARTLDDLYQAELAGQWQQKHANFTFIPVLSEMGEADGWQGRTGFLHDAVLDDFGATLRNYQVYACGAPVMVQAAHEAFVAQGLPQDEFFSDAFFSAHDMGQH